MDIRYKLALFQRRIFSKNGAKKLVPCIAVVIGWVCVLLTLKAQDAAAAQAATQLWVLPGLSMGAMVLCVGAGTEPLIVLFTTFLANIGITCQLLLDANTAKSLMAGYILGFAASLICLGAIQFISHCSKAVVEAASLVVCFIIFAAAMLSPAVNGSHIAVQVLGRSVLVGQPMLLVALAGVAAAISDRESSSAQRLLHAAVVAIINTLYFILMNELGSALILVLAIAVMIIGANEVELLDLLPVGVLAGGTAYLSWGMLKILGTKFPGSLFGKIWNKVTQRLAYVDILSKLDNLSTKELLGAAYQPVQAKKMLLTAKFFGPSPYRVHLPVQATDYVACVVANRLGVAAVLVLVVLVYIIFALGLVNSGRSKEGFVSTLGLGSAGALAAAAALNLLGATNTLPAVGVSMPFVSAGTTSLVCSMVMTGIVVCSSAKQKEENHEI